MRLPALRWQGLMRVSGIASLSFSSQYQEAVEWCRTQVSHKHARLEQPLSIGSCAIRAGMVKRIRGIAYSMRVSPQASNRLVDGARGVLNALLSDVYIFTDHMAGVDAGASPGYGLALVAETTAGRLLSAEAAAPAQLQARPLPLQCIASSRNHHLVTHSRHACRRGGTDRNSS